MATREYQSNSHRSKELAAEAPREKKEKVVSGKVKTKKNEKRSLMNMFISDDVGSVKSYIIEDVLVPTIKKTISEVVTNSVDMFLYGETRGSRRSSDGYVSYRKYSSRRDDDRRESSGVRTKFVYEDIEYEYRADAERVKRKMLEVSEEYGLVKLADLYEFSGMSAPHTAHDYGWLGLRNIDVVHTRDGYILKLPKAVQID